MYVPIITNSPISSVGKPIALVSAFLVVLAWHGTKRHYVQWVSLSALELVIEHVGVVIWSTQRFQASAGNQIF